MLLKITKLIFTIFLGIFFAMSVNAEERVDDFRVTIKLNEDASFLVTEEISYNFDINEKHGIFRDIRYVYNARGGKYKLRLDVKSVTDEHGLPYNFTVFKIGDVKRIKIGDADKVVQGQKKYFIKYQVERAINFFDDHDELYWNVTGLDWQVPISQSRALIELPSSVLEENIKAECFTGTRGSQKECVSKRYMYERKDAVKNVSFVDDKLNPGEGLSVVVSIPKGLIKKPSFFALAFEAIKDNWILGLPVATFFFMLFLWRQKGRDPEGRKTIIAQFKAPADLGPAEVGTIIDERANKKDISSEIIYLAIKGYVKIHQIEKLGIISNSKDYVLEKLKDFGDIKNEYEKKLLESFFQEKYIDKTLKKAEKIDFDFSTDKKMILLSTLKDAFYKDIKEIEDKVYSQVVEKGYFPKNPKKTRTIFTIIGVAILVLGWFSGPIFDFFGVFGIAISGIFVIIFGMYMPRKTLKGVHMREYILGLKKYLQVAEKDRINFHNAPSKNPEHFEHLLPFAIVLGVEKEWAKQFADIYDQETSWYSGPGNSHFSAMALSSSLGKFNAVANKSLTHQPSSASSGGSGFSGSSGGGFGGGGGGSW